MADLTANHGGRNKLFSKFSCRLSAALLAAFVILAGGRTIAQSQEPASAFSAFGVVSIKPYASDGPNMRIMMRMAPDGFSASGVTLQVLMQRAFGVEDNQLAGLPNWAGSDQYVVDAKVDSSETDAFSKLSPQDSQAALQRMMQAMLAERFGLVFHRETRQLPVYTLVVAKNGSKLHEAKPGDTYPNGMQGPDGRPGAGMVRMGMGDFTAQGVPLSTLASMLSNRTGRKVIDKTGLTGQYDISLKWTPEEGEGPMLRGAGGGPPGGPGPAPHAPDDASAPPLFTALQEQLGLKLESEKGPVEVVVVDRVQKPSAN